MARFGDTIDWVSEIEMSENNGSRQCASTNERGERCKMPPLRGADRCWVHDLSVRRERLEASARGGRNGRRSRPAPVGAGAIESADDVLSVIERELSLLSIVDVSAGRARAVATLCRVALDALSAGDIENRLQALEALVESRHGRSGGGSIR